MFANFAPVSRSPVSGRCSHPRAVRGAGGLKRAGLCNHQCNERAKAGRNGTRQDRFRASIGDRLSSCTRKGSRSLELWPDFADLDRDQPAKVKPLGITDRGGFQDHRHRPLGHPSASKSGENLRVTATRISALAGHVSPQVSRSLRYGMTQEPSTGSL